MSKNPFGEDNDLYQPKNDNYRNPQSSNLYQNDRNNYESSQRNNDYGYESKQTQLQRLQNETLESQQRSLATLTQTEETGIAAAEELMRQGEKLENTNRRLDNIEEIQKSSDKHINNLNSIFGGIKNIFKKSKKPDDVSAEGEFGGMDGANRGALRSAVAHSSNMMDHNGGGGGAGFAAEPSQQRMAQPQQQENSAYDQKFASNMNAMGAGISRVKNLASGLNEELKSQQETLDIMAPKMDRVNEKMTRQNKQLDRILHGKKK